MASKSKSTKDSVFSRNPGLACRAPSILGADLGLEIETNTGLSQRIPKPHRARRRKRKEPLAGARTRQSDRSGQTPNLTTLRQGESARPSPEVDEAGRSSKAGGEGGWRVRGKAPQASKAEYNRGEARAPVDTLRHSSGDYGDGVARQDARRDGVA